MFKAIKYLSIFLYHFFFIDQATGQQSNTKFFANVGYVTWSILFPIVVLNGITTNIELWLVFGAVVIGNRTLNVMMQNKYGAPQNPGQTWSNGVMTPTPPDVVTTSTVVTSEPTTQVTSIPATTTTTTSVGSAKPGIVPSVGGLVD